MASDPLKMHNNRSADRLTITMPLPHKVLSPNARPHWRVKAMRVKEARTLAAMLAGAGRRDFPAWTRAETRATFYWASNRRRDIRNAEHSLKAHYDGLVDAGVIVDDNADVLTHLPTRFEVDKENPRVVIEIWPVCATCGRDMGTASGDVGNVTHDGKLWCGCTPAQGAGGGEG